jgi:hypothetical protein
MPVFLLHCRTAWNDYFSATNPTNLKSQTITSRQTLTDSGVYVSNCLFNSIVESNQGGALCCSSSVTYFLVESTTFFSCKTSSNGGAIYFSNTNNGQSALHGVCGYDCSTTNNNHYQFAYIRVNNAASSKNYVNYSSITRVMNVNAYADHTLGLINGKICCQSVNSSMNNCYCVSGICCRPLSVSNYVTCSLTYSSFADNKDANWINIYLYTTGANFEIKSCNILRNTQAHTSTHGTFYTSGNVMIENSCILENKAPYIFTQTESSYTITVANCTLDKTTNNRNLIIQNTVTKSFVLALNHMSTRNCNAEYDSIGTLTRITPPLSSSNKQKLYYTCQRLFYQPQGSFVSLSSLLVILFINFGVSGDL